MYATTQSEVKSNYRHICWIRCCLKRLMSMTVDNEKFGTELMFYTFIQPIYMQEYVFHFQFFRPESLNLKQPHLKHVLGWHPYRSKKFFIVCSGHLPGRLTRSHPSSSASVTQGFGPFSSGVTSSTLPKNRLLSRWNMVF